MRQINTKSAFRDINKIIRPAKIDIRRSQMP